MELGTAIEILEYHQDWRLGKKEGMIHEPKQLTEAFDVVLSEVKKISLDNVFFITDQQLEKLIEKAHNNIEKITRSKYEVYCLMSHIDYIDEKLMQKQKEGWKIAGEILTKNKSGWIKDTYLHIPMIRSIECNKA